MENNTNIISLHKNKGKPGKNGQYQLLQPWNERMACSNHECLFKEKGGISFEIGSTLFQPGTCPTFQLRGSLENRACTSSTGGTEWISFAKNCNYFPFIWWLLGRLTQNACLYLPRFGTGPVQKILGGSGAFVQSIYWLMFQLLLLGLQITVGINHKSWEKRLGNKESIQALKSSHTFLEIQTTVGAQDQHEKAVGSAVGLTLRFCT